MTGRDAPCDMDRDELSHPIRWGGMGLINPCHFSPAQFHSMTVQITNPLVNLLFNQHRDLPQDIHYEQ